MTADLSPEPGAPDRAGRMLVIAAWCAAAALVLIMLVRAAQPIGTDDLFWHLALGEEVLDHGWPHTTDVFSHTAKGQPDVPQEWGAELIYAACQRAFGWYGLRALAGLVFLLATGLAAWTLRRQGAGWAQVAFGTALFCALGYWWLLQLRPHGFSMIGLFVLFALLERAPSRRAAFGVVVTCLVWINIHAVGLLGVIATFGLLLTELLYAGLLRLRPSLRPSEDEAVGQRAIAIRPAAALFAILLATSLLTPSGLDLWTFSFAHRDAMMLIVDEWSRLSLFGETQAFRQIEGIPHAAALLALGITILGALVAVATPAGRLRILRERRRVALAILGAALALYAVRFLFAWVVPVGWALAQLRDTMRARDTLAKRLGWIGAASAAIGSALLLQGYVVELDRRLIHAESVAEWKEPLLTRKLFPELATFLADAGVTGKLWNPYNLGGQLLYRLHPACEVFVDARTAVYGRELILDASRIEAGGANDLLDAYDVEVFCGVGFFGQTRQLGFGVLEGEPGWTLVFRSQEVEVRLRDEGGEANLKRIARYYEERAIPFDRERGFDPAVAVQANAEWARSMRLLPAALLIPLPEPVSAESRAQRFFGLGLAWERLGADRQAQAGFLAAGSLAPGQPEVQAALERVQAKLDRRAHSQD